MIAVVHGVNGKSVIRIKNKLYAVDMIAGSTSITARPLKLYEIVIYFIKQLVI